MAEGLPPSAVLDGPLAGAWNQVLAGGADDERLVTESAESPAPAVIAELPADLSAELTSGLRAAGITALYSHQREALESTRRANTVVTSGTASGKSLSFNLAT